MDEIFDNAICSMSFNKRKVLKYANQFALFLMLYCTIFTNIGFNGLKPVILITVNNRDTKLQKLKTNDMEGLLNEIHHRRKNNLWSS